MGKGQFLLGHAELMLSVPVAVDERVRSGRAIEDQVPRADDGLATVLHDETRSAALQAEHEARL